MSFTRQPLSVILTDSRGYALDLGAQGEGQNIGAPISVCLTDRRGYELQTGLGVGRYISAPIAVCLTDERGYELDTGFSKGDFFQSPIAAVGTDQNGYATLDAAALDFFKSPSYSICFTDAAGNPIPNANPITPPVAPTVIQAVINDGGVDAQTVDISAAVSGNAIVVYAQLYNDPTGHIASVTDNKGNTYSKIVGPIYNPDEASGGSLHEIWRADNVTGGPTTITVTPASASKFGMIAAVEVHGLGSTPTTKSTLINIGTNNWDDGGVTTLAANQLLLAFCAHLAGSTTAIAAGTGWTSVAGKGENSFVGEYILIQKQVAATAGAYHALATSTVHIGTIIHLVLKG